jgi:hypothetical protein
MNFCNRHNSILQIFFLLKIVIICCFLCSIFFGVLFESETTFVNTIDRQVITLVHQVRCITILSSIGLRVGWGWMAVGTICFPRLSDSGATDYLHLYIHQNPLPQDSWSQNRASFFSTFAYTQLTIDLGWDPLLVFFPFGCGCGRYNCCEISASVVAEQEKVRVAADMDIVLI